MKTHKTFSHSPLTRLLLVHQPHPHTKQTNKHSGGLSDASPVGSNKLIRYSTLYKLLSFYCCIELKIVLLLSKYCFYTKTNWIVNKNKKTTTKYLLPSTLLFYFNYIWWTSFSQVVSNIASRYLNKWVGAGFWNLFITTKQITNTLYIKYHSY